MMSPRCELLLLAVPGHGHLGHAAPGEAEEYAKATRKNSARRKENLLKQPSALALGPGSVQSRNHARSFPMFRVQLPKLSSFSTGASVAQPDRRHVEILSRQDPLMLD